MRNLPVGLVALLRALARARYGLELEDLVRRNPRLLEELLREVLPGSWELAYRYLLRALAAASGRGGPDLRRVPHRHLELALAAPY